MKITRSTYFNLIVLLFFTTATVVTAQKNSSPGMSTSDWVGSYEYEQVLSRNSNSGYTDTILYTLIISQKQKKGSLSARFTADGVQTSDDYECTVKIFGNRLDIYYLRDLSSTKMQDSETRFRKGELIGSLIKTTTRGRPKYTFRNKTYFGSKLAPFKKKK